jgi:Tol biopolymer transport system component
MLGVRRAGLSLLILFRLGCAAIVLGLTTAQVAFAAGSLLQVTADGAAAVRPAWSPNGQRIAFQTTRNGAYRVFTVASDGSDQREVSTGDADDRHPVWSPDGTTLAVDSGTELQREVWLLDASTGARTQLTHVGGFASFPNWKPDGSGLSFYVYQHGVLDLWTVDRDGNNSRQLTNGLASENRSQCTFACHNAAWSPDGSQIAYADGDQAHVFTMRTDGTNPVQVSPLLDGGRSHFPEYLADGRLTYVTEHISPGQSWTDVWTVVPGSGQPPTSLLKDVQVQGPFEFSPDGDKLLFASPRSGTFEIYVATLDAAGQEALKAQSADAEPAPGLPVGSRIQSTSANVPSEVEAQPQEPPASASGPLAIPWPAQLTPYVLALVAVAALWGGVELVARRRKSTGRTRNNGR